MKHTTPAWGCVGLLVALLVGATAATADAGPQAMSAQVMSKDIEYLAADSLGGRAPGSHGEDLTIAYLTHRFKELGYAPGNPNGTYTQEVPLVGMTVTNVPDLHLRDASGTWTKTYDYQTQFMGWTLHQVPEVTLKDAELVFVGYGVVAPEYHWNDYKDVDVKGKVLVMLVNDPPVDDPSVFGGKAMTYYGRWTYKYEIAAEKGAAGAIIIHNTEAAGYPWAVVSNSWSGEQFDVVRPDKGRSRCLIESWVTEDVARDIFQQAGRSLDEARAMAVSRDFRPFPLGLYASVKVDNTMRTITSHNVVARLPGSDPAHRDETIIYTAHWDHLGFGPPVAGDSIYNGAQDNASGDAGMLQVAAAFAGERDTIKRSILFLLTTAEESGLLGAEYYTDHPLYPLDKTVAHINVDGLNVWGRTRDMVVIGYGQSELEDYLQRALKQQGRTMVPDAEPEKGFYYRSDHFAFAKKGVPALYSDSGVDYVGKPAGWGMKKREEYNRLHYHKPSDEFNPNWDLSGAIEDMQALYEVGYMLATSNDWPQWKKTSEFRAAREAMMRGSR